MVQHDPVASFLASREKKKNITYQQDLALSTRRRTPPSVFRRLPDNPRMPSISVSGEFYQRLVQACPSNQSLASFVDAFLVKELNYEKVQSLGRTESGNTTRPDPPGR